MEKGKGSETTPSPETEKIRPQVNIEDQRLPGNLGWAGKLGDAIHRKVVQFDTWYNTTLDRTHSDYAVATAETMKARIGMLEQQRDPLEDRRNELEDRKQDIIESDSFTNRFAIGRWINEKRVRWHTLEQEALGRQIAKFEGKIKNANGTWQAALDRKSMHDRRINDVVKSAEDRLNTRLRPVENHRKRIDARIVELGNSTIHYEKIVVALEDRVDALKAERRGTPQTEAERQKRTDQITELKKNLREAKRSLTKAQEKLGRSYQHQERLANAQTIAVSAKETLITRYYRKVSDISTPVKSTVESSEEVLEEIGEDPIEAGLKKEPSNEQFIKLWNLTFPGAQIPSIETLFKMWERQFPPGDFLSSKKLISDETKKPDYKQSIDKWAEFLTELHSKSPEFQAFLKGGGGTKNVSSAIDMLSLSAALSTDI